MRWPWWFPYPNSWMRALSLIPFLPGVVVTSFWPLLFMLGDSAAQRPLLIVIISVFLLSFFLYSCCHHWIVKGYKNRSKFLKWLPHRLSLWMGLYAVLVLNIAVLPGFIISGYKRDLLTPYEVQRRDQVAVTFFVLISVCLFQAEFLLRSKLLKSKSKPNSVSS